MTLSRRLSDLEKGIRERRIGDDKAKFIRLIMPDYIETHDLEAGTITRVNKPNEQSKQAS